MEAVPIVSTGYTMCVPYIRLFAQSSYLNVVRSSHYFLATSFVMDGLSSASAVFAVVSVAVQLAETIHKLVDFWKAVEDAPDNIASIFRELGLLSKILTQSHESAQLHSSSDILDEALKDCCSKILKLHSKVENTRRNLNSSKLRKRKWAAWKIVLQKSEIDSLQKSISEARANIMHIQVNSILYEFQIDICRWMLTLYSVERGHLR